MPQAEVSTPRKGINLGAADSRGGWCVGEDPADQAPGPARAVIGIAPQVVVRPLHEDVERVRRFGSHGGFGGQLSTEGTPSRPATGGGKGVPPERGIVRPSEEVDPAYAPRDRGGQGGRKRASAVFPGPRAVVVKPLPNVRIRSTDEGIQSIRPPGGGDGAY